MTNKESLVDQIEQLDLKSCPQTILKIEGNINFFEEEVVGETSKTKQSWKKRLIDVANGASIKNFEVVRDDRVLFTFEGCPHLQVGIYKNKHPGDSSKGARFYLQTKGSWFMYEVFFQNCTVLVKHTNTDQKRNLVGRIRSRHHTYDPNAGLSIVQMMETERKVFGKREKVTQKSRETKTAIRKKKNL